MIYWPSLFIFVINKAWKIVIQKIIAFIVIGMKHAIHLIVQWLTKLAIYFQKRQIGYLNLNVMHFVQQSYLTTCRTKILPQFVSWQKPYFSRILSTKVPNLSTSSTKNFGWNQGLWRDIYSTSNVKLMEIGEGSVAERCSSCVYIVSAIFEKPP